MNDESSQQEQISPEEQSDQQHKALMEQIKAAITVHRSKNGGAIPTLDQVQELLKQSETQEQASESDVPKCLSFVVYHGKDPGKPMYYEDPSSLSYFDTSSQVWSQDRPKMIDNLHTRPVQHTDIQNLILHGIMDDNDYSQLHEAGMIDEHGQKLREKLNSLKDYTAKLEKSVDEIVNGYDSRPEAVLDAYDESDDLSEYGLFNVEEDELAPGTNVIQELIAQAMQPAQNPKLQEMIRAEVERILGERSQPKTLEPSPLTEDESQSSIEEE